MKTRRNLAVIAASGTGSRIDSKMPKQFLEIGGKPVLARTIECFEKSGLIDEIILAVPEAYLAFTSQTVVDKFNFRKIKKIISGGETRQESVLAGLKACPRTTGEVAIHDGVRPFVRQTLIDKLFEEVKKTGAVIPAVMAKETVKFVDKEMTCKTLPRKNIYLAQTPQVFNYAAILEIHEKAAEADYEATDDAMLAEQYGMTVRVVPGYYDNIKITTAEDLILAEELLKKW
jgi:2-C-methyl-D-erythritol 4-phosphate cytidylyltransferase